MSGPRRHARRRAGDPRRRQRHAPVAAQPVAPPEAVPVARRRQAGTRRCSSRPCAASQRSPTTASRSQPPCVVANEEHRFTVVEQLRGDRHRAGTGPARAVRPQHRAGAARWPRSRRCAKRPTASTRSSSSRRPTMRSPTRRLHRGAARRPCARRRGRASSSSASEPDRPDTGYGYIRVERAANAGSSGALRVAAFVEKPDRRPPSATSPTAAISGTAGLRPAHERLAHALPRFRPDIAEACDAARAKRRPTPRSTASTPPRSRRFPPTASTTP